MSQENVRTIRGLYEAFGRGDLDALEQGFSRNIVWNEADNSLYSAGNPYRSFSAIRDGVFLPSTSEYENFKVEVDQLLDAGDTIIGTGRYRGRCKATGKELSAQFCHVMHLDSSGKLDGLQEYADTFHEALVAGRAQPVEQQVKMRQPVL